MTDNALIIRAGEALYGQQWQAELARALDVNKSTVQDWRQGRAQPRAGVYIDLLRLALERGAQIDDVVELLRRRGGRE